MHLRRLAYGHHVTQSCTWFSASKAVLRVFVWIFQQLRTLQDSARELFIHTPFGLSSPSDRIPQFQKFDVTLPDWIDSTGATTEQRSHLKWAMPCGLHSIMWKHAHTCQLFLCTHQRYVPFGKTLIIILSAAVFSDDGNQNCCHCRVSYRGICNDGCLQNILQRCAWGTSCRTTSCWLREWVGIRFIQGLCAECKCCNKPKRLGLCLSLVSEARMWICRMCSVLCSSAVRSRTLASSSGVTCLYDVCMLLQAKSACAWHVKKSLVWWRDVVCVLFRPAPRQGWIRFRCLWWRNTYCAASQARNFTLWAQGKYGWLMMPQKHVCIRTQYNVGPVFGMYVFIVKGWPLFVCRIRELENKISELLSERSTLQSTISSLQDKLRMLKLTGAIGSSMSKKGDDSAREVIPYLQTCTNWLAVSSLVLTIIGAHHHWCSPSLVLIIGAHPLGCCIRLFHSHHRIDVQNCTCTNSAVQCVLECDMQVCAAGSDAAGSLGRCAGGERGLAQKDFCPRGIYTREWQGAGGSSTADRKAQGAGIQAAQLLCTESTHMQYAIRFEKASLAQLCWPLAVW